MINVTIRSGNIKFKVFTLTSKLDKNNSTLQDSDA